jgi:transcriptional regulator with XRE-family HTH domain
MSIGLNISKLRYENGMSQEELANELNVSQSYIAQIERGSKTPTLTLGSQIAKVFHVPISDLLE